MGNIKAKPGDIFLIPYKEMYAVCKILWISKRTKNVFSFIIKDKISSTNEKALNIAQEEKNIYLQLFTGLVEVFYTDITKIKKGEWPIIGNISLSESEEDRLQLHNIGGRLFKGDEDLGLLNSEDIKKYPKMLAAGYEAINNFLKLAFD